MPKYKGKTMKVHHFEPISRRLPYFCVYCGLITLNNDASRKARNKECPGKDYDD